MLLSLKDDGIDTNLFLKVRTRFALKVDSFVSNNNT
jgi:hypothetical protein